MTMKGYLAFEKINGIMNDLDNTEAMTVLMMMIDIVAGREGKRGDDFIKECLPIITEVNDSFGKVQKKKEVAVS